MIAKHPGLCRPHPAQDAMYGKDFRCMNPVKVGKGAEPGYRCTVCAPIKEPSKKRGGVHMLSTLVVLRR